MILKPDYNVESLFDIDFKEIKALGVNAVLFDLDSTVMPSKSGEYPPRVIELLNSLNQNFVVAIINILCYDRLCIRGGSVPFRLKNIPNSDFCE